MAQQIVDSMNFQIWQERSSVVVRLRITQLVHADWLPELIIAPTMHLPALCLITDRLCSQQPLVAIGEVQNVTSYMLE